MSNLRKDKSELGDKVKHFNEEIENYEADFKRLVEENEKLKCDNQFIKQEFEKRKDDIERVSSDCAEEVKKYKKKLRSKNDETIIYKEKYERIKIERMNLIDEIIEWKGRIRVYCRIRPLSK